jgi:hypothetical protein
MPLQIRRGPTSDRIALTPLVGELVYDTTTGAVYVGDGRTVGGVPVTVYSPADASQNVVKLFLGESGSDNTVHTGVSFQYLNNRLVATVLQDLSNYDGLINASGFTGSFYAKDSTLVIDSDTGRLFGGLTGDVIGSVFADNSTLLVDGVSARINLNGTVNDDVIPAAFGPDLGSSGIPFNNVYVGGEIRFNSATISSTGSVINLPAGSTVGGLPIGSLEGDLKGSVYSDDSTVLLDGTNGGGFNLDNKVQTDVTPKVSETYNLGSLSKKFKTLYVAESNGLYVGSAAISGSGTSINLPAGSKVGGIPIGTGGVVIGSNYNIGILADDTSLLVNPTTKVFTGSFTGDLVGNASSASLVASSAGTNDTAEYFLPYITLASGNQALRTDSGITFNPSENRITTAKVSALLGFTGNLTGDVTGNVQGNTTGTHYGAVVGNVAGNVGGFLTGDVKGSVFGDDSTLLVNGVDSLIPAGVVKGLANGLTGIVTTGTAIVNGDQTPGTVMLSLSQSNNADNLGGVIGLRRSRGTLASPTSVNTNDIINTITGIAHDGTNYVTSTAILSRVTGTVSTGIVPGSLEFATADTSGVLTNRLIVTNASTQIIKLLEVQSSAFSGNYSGVYTHYYDTQDVQSLRFYRSRGTPTSPASIVTGDNIGKLNFVGNGGGAQGVSAANIIVTSTGTVTSTSVQGYMSFQLRDGTSLADKFVMNNDGVLDHKQTALVAGIGSGQVNTGSVAGYMRVKLNGTQYALPLYTINP